MVSGSKVTDEAFSTRNKIMALLAVSGFGFSVCNSRMAASPSGVAALSRPSTLADRFITTAPCAGCRAGTSGIKRRNKGASARVITSRLPPACATRMMPSHNVITPARPREISKPVLAESNSDCISATNTVPCPVSSACASATAHAVKIIPAQIAFSI